MILPTVRQKPTVKNPPIGQGEEQKAEADTTAVLAFRVEAQPQVLAQTRALVRSLLELVGASEGEREDVALAVSEACANVIAHAYPEGTGPFTLRLEACRRRRGRLGLQVLVIDSGQGMSAASPVAGLRLGLSVMRRLAKRMQVRSTRRGCTEVRLTFELGGRPALARRA